MDKETKSDYILRYVRYLTESKTTADITGRYVKRVVHFLDNTESVSRRGLKKYKLDFASDIACDAHAVPAVCDFLNFLGVGYGRRRETKAKPLEKLSELSEKNKNLVNQFLSWIYDNNDYSEGAIRQFYDGMKQYFKYCPEFNLDNCRRYVATLEEEGYSPKTINIRKNCLEKFGEFAKKPVKLKRSKVPMGLSVENIPTEKEYTALLNYLKTSKNKDHYFWVLLLATTGARISEFLQFQWEDVLRGEVTLKGKGSKYRRIFFSKRVQQEVGAYVKETGKTGMIAAITKKGIYENMAKWAKATGIDRAKLHPHAFRHFFAKMYLAKNKDVVQLADILGHESVDTTRIYLQKSYDEQKRDFNRSVTW